MHRISQFLRLLQQHASAQYSHGMDLCQHKPPRSVDAWVNCVQRALWPATCVLCDQRGHRGRDLCAACEEELPRNEPACAVCALPLATASPAPLLCGTCVRRRPVFDRSHIPFRYGYPIAQLIHGLKYGGRIACGRVLGELLARRIRQRADVLPSFFVPIPLATSRYRKRGYNQAIELGRPVEKILGIGMRTDLAVRTRETREQTELDRKERRRNVRGAFSLAAELSASHVAILDDVVTTGSTVNELAKVLRRAGAARVEIWALARAGLT